jgi:hypothetical protein
MRCISNARSLYFRIILFSSLITFVSPETAPSGNLHVLFPDFQVGRSFLREINMYNKILRVFCLYLCSFVIITDYDIRFVVRDGSVGLHLLIP